MSSASLRLFMEAQERLVALLLFDSTQATRSLELVSRDDLEDPRYSSIFHAIAELARRDVSISPVSVAQFLEEEGDLERIGGVNEIYRLVVMGEMIVSEAPVEIFAKTVKELATKSRITARIKDGLPDFQGDSGVNATDALTSLQSFFHDELLSLSDGSTVSQFNESFESYQWLLGERAKRIAENEASGGLQGIPTLLPSLNDYTSGWLPGQLITVAAGTSIGKSIFALNCAVAGIQAGKSVMFFSLEMSEGETLDRVYASISGIPLSKLKTGNLTSEEQETLTSLMKELGGLKLTIDTEPKQTVDSIRARAIKQAQSQAGLDMIIIDYLQLVTPTGKFGSRQEAVADMSRNIKLLAKQLDIPIMILSQLSRKKRNEETNEEPLPKIGDVRESGAIEHDSDAVIFLHRERTNEDTIPHTLVILAKNRNGEANKIIRCYSNLQHALFREVVHATNTDDSLTNESFDYEEETPQNETPPVDSSSVNDISGEWINEEIDDSFDELDILDDDF